MIKVNGKLKFERGCLSNSVLINSIRIKKPNSKKDSDLQLNQIIKVNFRYYINATSTLMKDAQYLCPSKLPFTSAIQIWRYNSERLYGLIKFIQFLNPVYRFLVFCLCWYFTHSLVDHIFGTKHFHSIIFLSYLILSFHR